MASCPYNARYVQPSGAVGKCTFCEHRLKEGLKPACDSVCPAHAINFGNLNDPLSDVSKLLKSRKYKVITPEAGTEPNVYYLI